MEKQSVESKGSGVSTPDGGAPRVGRAARGPRDGAGAGACRGKEPKSGVKLERPHRTGRRARLDDVLLSAMVDVSKPCQSRPWVPT